MPSKHGKYENPLHRRCPCGGANPQCPQCGGSGVVESPGVRSIMAGPAGVRRRLPGPPEPVGKSLGPPEPTRCPHCGLDVLDLAAHVTEAHPEAPHPEPAADREAREQEAARQAAVAADLARREAEAAQRKAEARARRQAIEGPSVANPAFDPLRGRAAAAAPPAVPTAPARSPGGGGRSRETERRTEATTQLAPPADEAWGRLRRAWAERTVLPGVIRRRRPFGVFVDLGGIEGLVRNRELPTEEPGREAPGLHEGQPVQVVVIGLREETRQVELSLRRASDPRAPRAERDVTGPAEGPMALAFRVAREKKHRGEGGSTGDPPT